MRGILTDICHEEHLMKTNLLALAEMLLGGVAAYFTLGITFVTPYKRLFPDHFTSHWYSGCNFFLLRCGRPGNMVGAGRASSPANCSPGSNVRGRWLWMVGSCGCSDMCLRY